MKTEIKPCPFCKKTCVTTHEYNCVAGDWMVACDSILCCAIGPSRKSKEEAIKAWNQAWEDGPE